MITTSEEPSVSDAISEEPSVSDTASEEPSVSDTASEEPSVSDTASEEPRSPRTNGDPLPRKKKTIARIIETLGETEKQPITSIYRIVNRFGSDFALQVLEETKTIEEQGGLLVNDESRRRTVGGVFFYLIRGYLSKREREYVFAPVAFKWRDRLECVPELVAEKGEGKVKVTLIGRPGKTVEKRECTITMIDDSKLPNLPKGMPRPPEQPTSYMVYIGKKQWSRVREAIQDPEDLLIIEGHACYDPELEGVAIFATSTTTKLLQQQRRQKQKQSAGVSVDAADGSEGGESAAASQ